MKSSKIIITQLVLLVAILLAASFFVWKSLKKETFVLKIDEIQDVKGLGYSGQRKVAINGDGDIFVTYRKKYQGKYEIFVAKILGKNGELKTSGTSVPISSVGADADQRVPSINVDVKNNLHVVWYGLDGDSKKKSNDRQIKYSRSLDAGGSWTNWKNIALVAGYNGEDYWQEHPYVLAGIGGELFVAWEGKDENNKSQQIKFSSSFDGGDTWSAWKNVQETPSNTQSRPTMVREKNGRLHLFAYSSFGNDVDNQQIIQTLSDNNGETWSKWEAISDQNFDSRHASATIDSDGKIHIVWRSLDSSGHALIAHRFLQGGRWSEPQIVANSSVNQFFPSVVANTNGNISITWMESKKSSNLPNEDPADGEIYLSKFAAKKYSKPVLVGRSLIDLYPNLPEKTTAGVLPLLYESKGDSPGSFSLIINIER